MNDFLVIPEYQRKKSIPKPLKDIVLLPFNKGLETIVKPYLGDDVLRPVMSGIYFDSENKEIAATNAHVLIRLSMPEEDASVVKTGIYKTTKRIEKDYIELTKKSPDFAKEMPFDKWKSDRQNVTLEGKYPYYNNVIPEIDTERGVLIKIDLFKLYWFAEVMSNAEILNDEDIESLTDKEAYRKEKLTFLKEKYFHFINGTTHQILCRYKNIEGNYEFIGFNGEFLAEICKSLIQLGAPRFVNVYLTDNNKAMLFDIGNKNVALLMPVSLGGYGSNIDTNGYFKNEFTNKEYQVVYDFNENMIFSKGTLYPIDSSIGFEEPKSEKPKVPVSVPSKEPVVFTAEMIRKRIAGLQIALRLAEKKEKN